MVGRPSQSQPSAYWWCACFSPLRSQGNGLFSGVCSDPPSFRGGEAQIPGAWVFWRRELCRGVEDEQILIRKPCRYHTLEVASPQKLLVVGRGEPSDAH